MGSLMNRAAVLSDKSATIEEVVTKTLETTPQGATHWRTRLMAKKLSLSQSTVSRIWRAVGLKPHRSESFILSKDPQLVQTSA
jgi:DNA-binding MurR/RpiR family transcriptional regulator